MHGTPLYQTVLTMHQLRAVQTIDRYWHRLAAGQQVPRRSQIDPAAIQDALEFAFIAQHLSAGHARFRVTGGSISSVLGMEATGMPMAVLVSPDMRGRLQDEMAVFFKAPAKLRIALKAPARFGQSALDAELRLYPLRGADEDVTQVLGSFVTTGTIGRTPRRFRITATETCPLSYPARPTIRPIRVRGHLSLVVSNA